MDSKTVAKPPRPPSEVLPRSGRIATGLLIFEYILAGKWPVDCGGYRTLLLNESLLTRGCPTCGGRGLQRDQERSHTAAD